MMKLRKAAAWLLALSMLAPMTGCGEGDTVPSESAAPEQAGDLTAGLPETEPEPETAPAIPLDKIQFDILRTLLAGNPADGIIRENRLLPSVVADGINEAFFEEIGDSVIEENDGSLALTADYLDDVRRLLGG